MRNKLSDLNNHLFQCLEDLTNPLDDQNLEETIRKAKAVSDVGKNIINLHITQLKVAEFAIDNGFTMGSFELLDIESNYDRRRDAKNEEEPK